MLVLGCNKSIMTGLDRFLSLLMVLFYTLFPSMVSHIALMFSCKNYGHGVHTKSLLTGSGCGIVGVTATLDGGVVVQFGTRPRRRRQQQSFGDTFGDTLGCIVSTLWSKHVFHCSHVYILVKCTCQRTVPSHE